MQIAGEVLTRTQVHSAVKRVEEKSGLKRIQARATALLAQWDSAIAALPAGQDTREEEPIIDATKRI